MFPCSNCGGPLARTRVKAGIIWKCQACGGVAVGISLLRNLIGNDSVSVLWSQAIHGGGEPGRSCPICSRGMVEETTQANGRSLPLAICIPCEFAWLNAGEFESIPPSTQPEDPQQVWLKTLPQPLRERVALSEAKAIAEAARQSQPEPDAGWKAVPAALGLPVEMESETIRQTPWATLSLAALITLVSLCSFLNLREIIHEFGLIPAEAGRMGGLTFLTSFFIHAGIIHLAGNLYFLVVFGIPVEEHLGWRRWLLLVLAATVGGNLWHVAVSAGSQIPCIGASGGISGLIAYYAFRFPQAKIGIFSRYTGGQWIQLPAWGAFVLWTLLQLWRACMQLAGLSHVSAVSHIGGTAAGILLWAMWKKMDAQTTDAAATKVAD